MTPYQKLVAARKCTQCRCPLVPGEKKKCETCIATNRKKRTSKAARARDRQYARKSYAKDPETKRQAVRAEKDRKKREHECRDCPNPAEPDADHCADHTEKRRKYAQRMWRKTKARQNRERREAGRLRRLTRARSAAINSPMVDKCPNCDGPCIPTCVMSKRSLEDLLGERRLLCIDASHERDATARGVIEFGIAEIDHELEIRRNDRHNHPAPVGGPFVRGCQECERQWIAAGLGPVSRMKPLGHKEPAREIPEPDGNASEAAWDRADHEADFAADAAFNPADAEPVRHDP